MVTAVSPTVASGGMKKILGAGSLGMLMTAGFCIFDFLEVPKTFNSKYNSDGEKVDGKNWSGALKEVGKSIPKCASGFIVPALVTAATMCAGPLVATLGGIAAFVAPMVSYSLLNKVMPYETELIAKACEEKGINPDAVEDGTKPQMSYSA